ncbi:MAG TPA: peptidase S10 [Phycisphaerae bacterium]|nr:peptidase S10 [Phycisphaerae bacterium]HOM51909.1 peptidase S10 [Phycisphaerae bacterium]HON65667.1 peptidase S10 [Phycisphaerae bacterium]HOQ88121.1 peptidase S10 [Phycisphaerae bacterium]HPP28069.1 peptidase S10 [Phycisphaerae bacterium]
MDWHIRFGLFLAFFIPAVATGRATRPADEAPSAKAGESTPAQDQMSGSIEKAAVTFHTLELPDGILPYRATAANMLLKDEDGKRKGSMFFVAYDRLSRPIKPHIPEAGESSKVSASAPAIAEDSPAARPITFVFNGGPGAAAVWLHLGTAGPKRIDLPENGFAPPPPFRLTDNHETWLTYTDLVFVDPVGTGFSRPAEGEKAEQFYGVTQDIRWVSEFIRLYLTIYRRWSSPVFLAGESYGTTRAAGLSDFLVERHGIALNGIILISSVLSFQTLRFGDGNDLPYVLYVPTYAAIAHYHGQLGDNPPPLDQLLPEVENWAIREYAVALARGDSLPPADREHIARTLSRYTGLDAELILRNNLRISAGTFQKHLLSRRRRIVGRFDGRMTGFELNPGAGWPEYDPSLSQFLPIYTSTFNDYVRRELNYDSVLTYEVLSDKVRPWKYGEEGTGYLTVVDELRQAMAKNPALKVMFASAYHDLATPFFATWYTVNHLDIGPLRDNIVERIYPGGHMMYHAASSRIRLQQDVAQFIRWATIRDGTEAETPRE